MNDIVTTSFFDNTITILLWNPVAEYWNLGITKNVGDGPLGVSIGDVNNDGNNEIVIAIREEDLISILTWNDNKADWDHINKAVGDNPNQVYIADANNDNINDIVVTNYNEGSASIFLGSIELRPDISGYELNLIIIGTILGFVIIILKKVKILKYKSTI